MKRFRFQGRTLALLGVAVPLLALFIFVALRSGPLAPVAVTVIKVQSRTIRPALFGIGTVEARYTYKIGPTYAGRIKRLDVHVGDQIKAGQELGEMDPVDLDDRVRSQQSAYARAQATLREAQARQAFAQTQARRYEQLFAARSTSEEIFATKRQELQVADADRVAARQEVERTRYDLEALVAQRSNLRLVAPSDGVVSARDADPGTTIVAGQSVVEVIDPKSLWINVRFDQISARGLAAGLAAHIALRSRGDQMMAGRVLRVEPKADAVTEETLSKVIFDVIPRPMPPVGELAEVTVDLHTHSAAPVIPNAAVQREGDKVGIWRITDGDLRFTPIKLGVGDLNGDVQVQEGLKDGDRVVVYSEKALTAHSRIHVVDRLPEVSR
ncbi:MAG: efflux RND transporter periplasmic adaptor subunit [Paraburkholderia sp.]|nr:MAG: efflux RND transporter periplasmic adaptor subunit [Paraburkholderia sp.]